MYVGCDEGVVCEGGWEGGGKSRVGWMGWNKLAVEVVSVSNGTLLGK